jgi:TatD DNase family protein
MKKNYGRTTWVIHGFVRNKILAKQVLDSGCYLSVAPCHQMTTTFSDTLVYIPLDRMFIETDSDFRADIKKRYELFSHLRKCSAYELKKVIFSNFVKFYSEKWKYQPGWNEQNS